jgi:hypothetical protein
MFRCKFKDETIRSVSWEFIDGAWLAAITACQAHVGDTPPEVRPPNVTQLAVVPADGGVDITWKPHPRLMTEIQIKVGSGEWTTLDLVPAGTGEL